MTDVNILLAIQTICILTLIIKKLENWKQNVQSIEKFWRNQLMQYHAIIKNGTHEEWAS